MRVITELSRRLQLQEDLTCAPAPGDTTNGVRVYPHQPSMGWYE